MFYNFLFILFYELLFFNIDILLITSCLQARVITYNNMFFILNDLVILLKINRFSLYTCGVQFFALKFSAVFFPTQESC